MKIVYLIFFLAVACRPSNQIGELVGVINERPLEETVWLLMELNGQQISTVEGKPISVLYQNDGNKVSGFAGCNSFTGSFIKQGTTISAKLGSTRMYCEGKMDMETEILRILNLPAKYELNGNHLYLKEKGKVVAKFLAEIKTSG